MSVASHVLAHTEHVYEHYSEFSLETLLFSMVLHGTMREIEQPQPENESGI